MPQGDEDRLALGITTQNFFQLSIYGPERDHVVTFRLQRQHGMTIGDMAQLQNFFWVTLGTAVRNNEEMKRHLTHAGFEVVLDDPAAQGEPAGAN